jgi:flagellar biosynthesis protein FliR
MANIQISTSDIAILLAILLRVSIILFLIPAFTGSQVPHSVKALITLALGFMMYGLVKPAVTPLPFDILPLLWIVMGEIILGAFLALTTLMVLAAFQLGGELISFQMGFSFAQAVDPQNGGSTMVLSRWFQIMATLIFFSLNGHHVIISGIAESFRNIPMGGFSVNTTTLQHILTLSKQLLVIALKLSAPITVTILLGQVALGLASKFAPQLNVLASSFPLTILLGFLFIGISATLWGEVIGGYLGYLLRIFEEWLKSPQGPMQ